MYITIETLKELLKNHDKNRNFLAKRFFNEAKDIMALREFILNLLKTHNDNNDYELEPNELLQLYRLIPASAFDSHAASEKIFKELSEYFKDVHITLKFLISKKPDDQALLLILSQSYHSSDSYEKLAKAILILNDAKLLTPEIAKLITKYDITTKTANVLVDLKTVGLLNELITEKCIEYGADDNISSALIRLSFMLTPSLAALIIKSQYHVRDIESIITLLHRSNLATPNNLALIEILVTRRSSWITKVNLDLNVLKEKEVLTQKTFEISFNGTSENSFSRLDERNFEQALITLVNAKILTETNIDYLSLSPQNSRHIANLLACLHTKGIILSENKANINQLITLNESDFLAISKTILIINTLAKLNLFNQKLFTKLAEFVVQHKEKFIDALYELAINDLLNAIIFNHIFKAPQHAASLSALILQLQKANCWNDSTQPALLQLNTDKLAVVSKAALSLAAADPSLLNETTFLGICEAGDFTEIMVDSLKALSAAKKLDPALEARVCQNPKGSLYITEEILGTLPKNFSSFKGYSDIKHAATLLSRCWKTIPLFQQLPLETINHIAASVSNCTNETTREHLAYQNLKIS